MAIKQITNPLAWPTSDKANIVTHHPTLKNTITLFAICVLGAFVRFYNPSIIDWSSDHSDIALIVQDIVAGKGISLVGLPSSSGLPNSPFFIYPLIIPYAFTDNPIIVTAFITTLNLLSVVLIWMIAFRYFGPLAAAVAALAFAVHPWGVGYGRSIWSGDHRTFILLIGIILGLRGFFEGRRLAQILCLPVILIAIQIHYAAWPLMALYAWMVWSGRQKTKPVTLLLSALLGLLTILPFGLGIYQTLTDPVDPVAVQPLHRELTLYELIKPSGQMVWLATGLGTERYVARESANDLVRSVGLLRFLWLLQGATTVLGLGILWRQHAHFFAVLFSIWILLPLLVFTIPILAVVPHYFIPVIPSLCLLFGIGFAWLVETLKRWRPALPLAVWAVYALIVITQARFIIFTYDYINTHFTPTQFGFGTPVSYFLNASKNLRGDQDLVFITSNDWLDRSRTGSHVWAPFLRDSALCLRDIPVDSNMAVFPAKPFVAIFAPRTPVDPTLTQVYEVGTPWIVPLRPGEGSYRFYWLEQPRPLIGLKVTRINPYRFENDVQLSGYQIDDKHLYLSWKLPDRGKGKYSYQIQYLDGTGKVLDTQREPFWAANNWCADDQLITWAEISLPQGTQTLRVELIREGAKIALSVQNASGHPAEDGAVIILSRDH